MLPLASICEQLHRDAAAISLPSNMMPSCLTPDVGGLHIALTPDGAGYVLTYSEKGDAELLLDSDNADLILEKVFDELTLSLAAEQTATGTVSRSHPDQYPENPTNDQLRTMTISFQQKIAPVQEALLARLSPQWAHNQAVRNAERLRQIEAMFDGK